LQLAEVDQEAANYHRFIEGFNPGSSGAIRLWYMVAKTDTIESEFEPLDKVYERYDREDFGRYVLYKLRPR